MTRHELQPGAANAIRVCLNVQPNERVTLITDHACRDISDALIKEIEAVGAAYAAFVLEDEASRPLSALPGRIAEDMEKSDVSIFAAQVQANELRSRMDMTDIVNRRHMRHAHMVNITPRIMTEGMRADFRTVDRISQRVIEKVRTAKTIRATTPAGTDIAADLNPAYRWIKTSGLITREKWGNLPVARCLRHPAM
jgi:leucyl aminopeptidase (aminopeptidase T)